MQYFQAYQRTKLHKNTAMFGTGAPRIHSQGNQTPSQGKRPESTQHNKGSGNQKHTKYPPVN